MAAWKDNINKVQRTASSEGRAGSRLLPHTTEIRAIEILKYSHINCAFKYF